MSAFGGNATSARSRVMSAADPKRTLPGLSAAVPSHTRRVLFFRSAAAEYDHEPPEARHYKSKLDLIDFCPLSGHGGYRRIVQCLPRQPSIRASHIRSMRPRQVNRMVRLIHRQNLPQERSPRRRRLLLGVLGVLVLVAALWFGIPYILLTLSTVSTDDAFVNGHVTFVAARVHGQVSRVLVDDNNRVHKGDLLVELDKEPFLDAVAVKKAAVDSAEADLQAARAQVRGMEAQA